MHTYRHSVPGLSVWEGLHPAPPPHPICCGGFAQVRAAKASNRTLLSAQIVPICLKRASGSEKCSLTGMRTEGSWSSRRQLNDSQLSDSKALSPEWGLQCRQRNVFTQMHLEKEDSDVFSPSLQINNHYLENLF